jgi:hypothetical protein
MKRLLVVCSLSIMLNGCVLSGGTYFEFSDANLIKNGMTKDQVIAILKSPPLRVEQNNLVWEWRTGDISTGNTGSRMITIPFDKDGKSFDIPEGGLFKDYQQGNAYTYVPKKVVVKTDKFESNISFSGPEEKYDLGVYFIRSWLAKNGGKTTHQLYLISHGDHKIGSSPRRWISANDENAGQLKITSIDYSVDTCTNRYKRGFCFYTDHTGVNISDETLTQSKSKGFSIKMKADDGKDPIIFISPELIKLQLDAIESNKK